jgi:hypothetical protein
MNIEVAMDGVTAVEIAFDEQVRYYLIRTCM